MAKAQVPYFAKTVGQNRMYAYTSMKVRPSINSQETYTTFQYGLSNSLATGLDLYTSKKDFQKTSLHKISMQQEAFQYI